MSCVFRISPEESRDDDAATKRRGKSAPNVATEISRHIMEKVAPDGGVQSSPPDPLEPWSTKDIKSINKILDNSDRD
jgi:hypothetical protein